MTLAAGPAGPQTAHDDAASADSAGAGARAGKEAGGRPDRGQPLDSSPPLLGRAEGGRLPVDREGRGRADDVVAAVLTWRRGRHRRLRPRQGQVIVIAPEAWAGGLGAALLIGALAGLLPAIHAARLTPTQALWTL